INPYTYFQRTPQPTTTPQLPVVTEFYPENQFAPNTTPLRTPPLQRQLQTLDPQPEFIQPQFIGAYPDQGIVEQVPLEEEINLEEVNLQEQVEEPHKELVESEEEASEE